jgi:hypothetical protein
MDQMSPAREEARLAIIQQAHSHTFTYLQGRIQGFLGVTSLPFPISLNPELPQYLVTAWLWLPLVDKFMGGREALIDEYHAPGRLQIGMSHSFKIVFPFAAEGEIVQLLRLFVKIGLSYFLWKTNLKPLYDDDLVPIANTAAADDVVFLLRADILAAQELLDQLVAGNLPERLKETYLEGTQLKVERLPLGTSSNVVKALHSQLGQKRKRDEDESRQPPKSKESKCRRCGVAVPFAGFREHNKTCPKKGKGQ